METSQCKPGLCLSCFVLFLAWEGGGFPHFHLGQGTWVALGNRLWSALNAIRSRIMKGIVKQIFLSHKLT